MTSFFNNRYNNYMGCQKLYLKIVQIATRLEEVNMPMTDDFVVPQFLNSLAIEYEQLEISYTLLRDKWSIHELISVCVHEGD